MDLNVIKPTDVTYHFHESFVLSGGRSRGDGSANYCFDRRCLIHTSSRHHTRTSSGVHARTRARNQNRISIQSTKTLGVFGMGNSKGTRTVSNILCCIIYIYAEKYSSMQQRCSKTA